MKRFVCEECGKILEARHIVTSRNKHSVQMGNVLAQFAEKKGEDPPPEQNYHSVHCNEGCAPGAMGGIWRMRLCGPLREANAQDEYLEQLGVVKRG